METVGGVKGNQSLWTRLGCPGWGREGGGEEKEGGRGWSVVLEVGGLAGLGYGSR